MNDRLFEIDSNANLNALYIIAFMTIHNSEVGIKSLMVSLFLMKYPNICLELLDTRNKKLFKNNLENWEINNLQNEMHKYTSAVYDEGFNNGMAFLYSRNLIDYNLEKDILGMSKEANEIQTKSIPQNLINRAKFVSKVISMYSIEELEYKIKESKKV